MTVIAGGGLIDLTIMPPMPDAVTPPIGGTKAFFTHTELCDPETRTGRLAPGFADHLAMLRLYYARPMIVNSCCRSRAYSRRIGGHPRSLHVWDNPWHPTGGTCAIDIASVDPKLTELALRYGWSVGVYAGFTHLDRRDLAGLDQRRFPG